MASQTDRPCVACAFIGHNHSVASLEFWDQSASNESRARPPAGLITFIGRRGDGEALCLALDTAKPSRSFARSRSRCAGYRKWGDSCLAFIEHPGQERDSRRKCRVPIDRTPLRPLEDRRLLTAAGVAIPAADHSSLATSPTTTPLQRTDAYAVTAHAAALAAVAAGKGSGVVFFGDSITQAWAWNGFGLPAWQASLAPLGAADFGVGSDQTQNVLWRLLNGETRRPPQGRCGHDRHQ